MNSKLVSNGQTLSISHFHSNKPVASTFSHPLQSLSDSISAVLTTRPPQHHQTTNSSTTPSSSSTRHANKLMKALRAPLASVEELTSSLESSAWSIASRAGAGTTSSVRSTLLDHEESALGMTASRFSV